jgi:hypothetical protein
VKQRKGVTVQPLNKGERRNVSGFSHDAQRSAPQLAAHANARSRRVSPLAIGPFLAYGLSAVCAECFGRNLWRALMVAQAEPSLTVKMRDVMKTLLTALALTAAAATLATPAHAYYLRDCLRGAPCPGFNAPSPRYYAPRPRYYDPSPYYAPRPRYYDGPSPYYAPRPRYYDYD